ncbi:hypothetical protein LTR78_003673 [Recurvomyces mirabilis]|uniref:Uncharacterized protein n=1 Tax=Recurvomyces mirabilis TaxID=574656 RepID=A0AAE0WRB5_9PEZI|nr:hypothetical protein LTR78_003673 [Recurvomyces mirabilis]KAK5154785.1 hypothetical protein LTS14_006366 [Recurvomyces mirabilis]
MPSRLSKLFRSEKLDKEKEAEADAERSRSSGDVAPPAYAPPEYDQDNVLDPPDMTAGFANLKLSSKNKDGVPTIDECAAHLKLLECFYRLKQSIGSRDGIYGISDSVVTQHIASGDKANELLAKLAEKRWAIYLHQAVDRFDAWLHALMPDAKPITYTEYQTTAENGSLCHPSPANPPFVLEQEHLPPVDVLMVWHSYMLNPRAYLEDCLRLGRMRLWHTDMPWHSISSSINAGTFKYEPGEVTEGVFAGMTGLKWDSASSDVKDKSIVCPSCQSQLSVPWTAMSEPTRAVTESTLPDIIDGMLSTGTGYCDKDLLASCPSCKTTVTHERLRAGKFCSDIKKLLNNDTPMGGTMLGTSGLPGKAAGQRDILFKYVTLPPNNILRDGLGGKLLASTKAEGDGFSESMQGIRDVIEAATQDKAYMRKVRGSASHRLTRAEKIGIRRMMSRYWDNSSPFALDLVGAVVRQGSFIEKMHNIDWLHSPALPSTMKRLLTKYERFVQIMADQHNMAVPTLDVDLAWHSHQLSPSGYMEYTIKATKQFIDHDDKVAETKLNDAFAWTSKTYQRLFNEPYSECTCWYCEAVRESHTSTASRLFHGSQSRVTDSMVHKVETDSAKSVHISSHNAVRPSDDTNKYQITASRQADELDKAYRKACIRASKNGKPAPKRENYSYSDAWGYPVYMPAYAPYIGYAGYCPAYYPMNPGCMAVGADAVAAALAEADVEVAEEEDAAVEAEAEDVGEVVGAKKVTERVGTQIERELDDDRSKETGYLAAVRQTTIMNTLR